MEIVVIAWALLTLSLWNTIVQYWLGWMVLLNAERRTWGVWMVAAGLLVGGTFFGGHALAIVQGLEAFAPVIRSWWMLGWLPGILLPYAWYVAILWHNGFFERNDSRLYRRHQWLLPGVSVLGAGVAALLIHLQPLPPALAAIFGAAGRRFPYSLPLVVLTYPLFLVLSIGLSLDALRHPGPATRVMGDLARRRARPWLIAVSGVLLLVGLLVGGAALRLAAWFSQRGFSSTLAELALFLARTDLSVTCLISLATLLLGQGMVSYEIFTGKTLPRRGLQRRWQSVAGLSFAYCLLAGLVVAFEVPALYSLLAIAGAAPLFHALIGWRSFLQREREMARLHPILGNAGVHHSLLTGSAAAAAAAGSGASFRVLCEEVLGTRVAFLAPLGPLAPLAGPVLAYPPGTSPPESLPQLAGQCVEAQQLCFALDAARSGGAHWAVPLWSARGLVGVLLLGEKSDGGLYTQEEMEFARASTERLVDLQATAGLAERLMDAQRRQLAESQVLDQRARRVIHDEVLPQLHAAMLALSALPNATRGPAAETLALLGDAHRGLSGLLREMPSALAPDVARWGLVGALRRLLDSELPGAFDSVAWEVSEDAERAAEALPPLVAEVVYGAAREAMRNAARYARGGDAGRPLHLGVRLTGRPALELSVVDDGVGLEQGTPSQGSGQGLALHGTMMAVVGGSLSIESAAGKGTRVLLSLPTNGE